MRPCIVTLGHRENKRAENALFYGVYQDSSVRQALLIGETGGQISAPVAVVEINRKLLSVNLSRVEFTDTVGDVG
ncbi:hypothetical protein EP56_10925 [Listeriaceae bacterium FSL A5-0209]|nr:hypothetical protein EP56_10925 [Listeriaceae bacterium FSL A5-0209]